MSTDDERPSTQLLEPLSQFELPQADSAAPTMASSESSRVNKPCPIIFPTRKGRDSVFTQNLLKNCETYDRKWEQLLTWLKETSSSIAKQGYPDTDHPFIIY